MNKLELLEKLRHYDEVLLLELLDINADDIIDKFSDKVYERLEYIYSQVSEEEREIRRSFPEQREEN